MVNVRSLQLECARVLHDLLLVAVLIYSSDIMIWKKERSRIMAVQMDNLRGLLGIRRIDKVSNACIKELCGLTKWVEERIDEGVLRWFDHLERMENYRIANRVYVG